jgi:Na+/H+-translocating membrane pyrophosphatase
MEVKALGRIGRLALWLAPIVIVAAFFALWGLKQNNPAAASVLGPVVAISLMAYTTFITSRQQRRLDEVQIASQGFANGNGLVYGASATVLLLMLPPVSNWLVDLVNTQSTGSPEMSDRRAVGLAYVYGVSLVVAMQALVGLVAAGIWWRRMGGMKER